jgi:glycerophosphoryl diester phosphodiesterase
MKISTAQFDVQGHRGCRGLFPENTIPAFIKAVQLGVTTLELDVVITSDHKVLVSHDPYMSHLICLAPDGKPVSVKDRNRFNIYKMNAVTAQKFDCGTLAQKKFPEQHNFKVNKPLLSEMIDAVESYTSENNLPPVRYNIETKCSSSGDGIFHPSPDIFADLVVEVLVLKKIIGRSMIQSFDVRTLQHLKKMQTNVELVLLVENTYSPSYNLKNLGFTPEVYSPYFKLISQRQVKQLHAKGIKVIPWTVNQEKDMKRLINIGVDGIITDYPDRLIKVVNP